MQGNLPLTEAGHDHPAMTTWLEKNIEIIIVYWHYIGLYRDNGQENGNYHSILGLYRDNRCNDSPLLPMANNQSCPGIKYALCDLCLLPTGDCLTTCKSISPGAMETSLRSPFLTSHPPENVFTTEPASGGV